jgi:hypothetical protein
MKRLSICNASFRIAGRTPLVRVPDGFGCRACDLKRRG